jgi:hypothetical protein
MARFSRVHSSVLQFHRSIARPQVDSDSQNFACASTTGYMPLCPGRRSVLLYSLPDGEYKICFFKSVVDSPKSRLEILGAGWDGAPIGQSLLLVISIVMRKKVLVGHSKTEHFSCVIQVQFIFYLCRTQHAMREAAAHDRGVNKARSLRRLVTVKTR